MTAPATQPFLGHTTTKVNADLDALWAAARGRTPLNVRDHGAVGDGVHDDTAAIQATMGLAGGTASVIVPVGTYKITGKLTCVDNQIVQLESGTQITQTVPNTPIFEAVHRDNVWIHCFGGTLYGEGSWSAAWNDFDSHADRGINLLGCTNSGVTFPRIRNMAMCGIAVLGGSNITIVCPEIEGTHALGHPLQQGVSIYQFGMVIMHDLVYGAFNNVTVISPVVYNAAMGINSVMNILGSHGLLTIINMKAHTFLAEHALYLGTSNTHVIAPHIRNCGLDGIKIFSGVANEAIESVTISDFNISQCAQGQAVELGVSGNGSIVGVKVSGVATDCARALTIDGDVRGCKAHIVAERMTQYGLYMAASLGIGAPSDCDVEIITRDSTFHGVLVDAIGSTRNRIKPKIVRPGVGGTSYGMFVHACADLTVESPDIFDDSGSNMQIGMFVDVGANNVEVHGHPKVHGYTDNGFSFNGPGAKWFADPGDFDSYKTAFGSASFQFESPALLPVSPLLIARTSLDINPGVLWNVTMDDHTAYLVHVHLTGKQNGGTDRGGFVASAVFFRNGGGATLQGAAVESVNVHSGGFTGVYSLSPNGNDIRLLVNSGASVSIDWIARVTVTKF